ncbi:putative secreted domain protein [Escherichia coli DEC4F]|nr:putative secreted domain protein [Escherichia coli DEC4F]
MAIHVEHVGVLERAREVSRLEDIITEDNEDIEAEMPKMRDDPAGKEARFLQATDEMSAALTQFMKKKIYEEQLANFLDGEEYVLEDQPIEKPTKLWRRLRLQLPMTMKCIALLKNYSQMKAIW